jgi:hypothetical protein
MAADASLLVRQLRETDAGVPRSAGRPSLSRAASPDVLRLLAQLTVVGDVQLAAFQARVRELASGQERVLVVQGS